MKVFRGQTRSQDGQRREMVLFQEMRRAVPEASDRELAELLQLDLRKVEKNVPKGVDIAIPPLPERPDPSPQAEQPAKYPPATREIPFIYQHRYQLKEKSPEPDPPTWLTEKNTFKNEIQSSRRGNPAAEPLCDWRDLWPQLQQLFLNRKKTRRLDIPCIIDHAVRRKPLAKIPWQTKKAWPADLVVVMDLSPHLAPFHSDYLEVVQSLCLWFRQRVRIVYCSDGEQQSYFYDGKVFDDFPLPAKGLHVLYLGDLGVLDGRGLSQSQWYFQLSDLLRAGCCLDGLLSISPKLWSGLSETPIHPYFWPEYCIDAEGITADEALEKLLAASSLAFEQTPLLFRKLRRFLRLDMSLESQVMQHSALRGRGYVRQWCNRAIRDKYHRDFIERFSSEEQQQIWQIISSCESSLPFELQIEQRQIAGRELNEDQNTFLRRMLSSLHHGSLTQTGKETVFDWVGRMAGRSGDECWAGLTNLLFGYYKIAREPSVLPAGIDISALPQWLGISERIKPHTFVQRANRLHMDDPAETGFTLATVQATENAELLVTKGHEIRKYPLKQRRQLGDISRIDEVRISTRNEELTFKTMCCPSWANGIGRDRYGLFVEVQVKGTRFVMRWIPPGSFLMGSLKDEPERFDDEGPQHLVKLEKGFWLAETACSQELWQAVMGEVNNPSRFKEEGNGLHPVENVTWELVQDFINRLNAVVQGLEARLPSEAEWEYGCRAGKTTPFWFGDKLTTRDANYDGNEPYNNGQKGEYRQRTVPVKCFVPNPWGLYQMHGNVWEWCQDRWHDNYEGAPDDGRPWETGDNELAVVRGGSWSNIGGYLRSACRSSGFIGFAFDYFGFRLARGPEQ